MPEPILDPYSLEGLTAFREKLISGETKVDPGLFGFKINPPDFLQSFVLRATEARIASLGGLGGTGAFGLSATKVGMSGEVERARLDILERMKRTTDSRAKSRLTLPKLFGDGKKETNILADVL